MSTEKKIVKLQGELEVLELRDENRKLTLKLGETPATSDESKTIEDKRNQLRMLTLEKENKNLKERLNERTPNKKGKGSKSRGLFAVLSKPLFKSKPGRKPSEIEDPSKDIKQMDVQQVDKREDIRSPAAKKPNLDPSQKTRPGTSRVLPTANKPNQHPQAQHGRRMKAGQVQAPNFHEGDEALMEMSPQPHLRNYNAKKTAHPPAAGHRSPANSKQQGPRPSPRPGAGQQVPGASPSTAPRLGPSPHGDHGGPRPSPGPRAGQHGPSASPSLMAARGRPSPGPRASPTIAPRGRGGGHLRHRHPGLGRGRGHAVLPNGQPAHVMPMPKQQGTPRPKAGATYTERFEYPSPEAVQNLPVVASQDQHYGNMKENKYRSPSVQPGPHHNSPKSAAIRGRRPKPQPSPIQQVSSPQAIRTPVGEQRESQVPRHELLMQELKNKQEAKGLKEQDANRSSWD